MRRAALTVTLTPNQQTILSKLASGRTTERRLYQRATIILEANAGTTNSKISKDLNMRHETISHWRDKWVENQEKLNILELKESGKQYESSIIKVLSDRERPGTPCKFTAEQVCQIIAVACESPESLGYPVSHWSGKLLAKEVARRGIVESISATQTARFLKSGRYKAT